MPAVTDLTRLRQLMTEIGPALGLAGVAEYGDGGVWALLADETTEVWVEWDADAGSLAFSVDVGVPAPEARAALFETLLVYNDQRARTGGVYMSLAAPDGPVVQRLTLGAADLDLAGLAGVLSAFVDISRGWRQVLAGAAAADPAAGSAPGPDLAPPPGGVRV